MSEREQIIADYCAAYMAANGREVEHISYQRGWFIMRRGPHSTPSRYRKAAVLDMTATLNARAANQSPNTGGTNA